MTKERFLSVYEMYTLRKCGCENKSAKAYANYVNAINSHAMKLGCPDYLEWIAECSNFPCIENYIKQLENSISSITVASTKSNYRAALGLLKQFTDEIFQQSCAYPLLGNDKKSVASVSYRQDVDTRSRVPNLSVDLRNEYIRVVDFARYIFGDLFEEQDYAFIPVILSPDKPVTIYTAKPEYLSKLSEKRERQDTTEDENEIIKSKKICCRSLAKFYEKTEPKIEIYYQNTCTSSYEDYLSKIKNVLAHEYMHYLHACYCNKIGNNSTFFYENISEGVAEFFAMLFSLYRGGVSDWYLCEQKYWNWAKMFNSGWPYANALYLYNANGKEHFYTERIWDFKENRCIEKMVDVLKNSTDFADAYKIFKS